MRFLLYTTVATLIRQNGTWLRSEYMDFKCEYPATLPANHSGIKVIQAGFAKMGTRTLSRTLWELGYERSYHGEEFLMHVWHPQAAAHWRKPENGGMRIPYLGTFNGSKRDLEVLGNLSSEKLAAEISRCKVDTVAFDGSEALFWPVLRVSPGAKVIVMNWRTYQQAWDSAFYFAIQFFPYLLALGYLDAAGSMLPWGAFLYILDPLFGRQWENLLKTGLPLINQVENPWTVLFDRNEACIRYAGHWHQGLCEWFDMDAERYDAFFEEIARVVPRELRMDFDPRNATYEDLCAFLEMKECKKSGRLPRAVNLGNHELDFLPAMLIVTPIWMLMHWVNWRIFWWVFSLVWRLLWSAIELCIGCSRRGLDHYKGRHECTKVE